MPPALQTPVTATGSASACRNGLGRHRPGRPVSGDQPGVLRARCRGCGLKLMRTAISRHWIIADRLG